MNNQDDELDRILRDFNDGSAAEEAWVDAKAAILAWHNKRLEQAVIEARISELTLVRETNNAYRFIDRRIAQLSKSSKMKEHTS